MSSVGFSTRREKIVNFDRILLGVAVLLVLGRTAVIYVCLHGNLPWLFAAYGAMVDLIETLPLPENLASAIIGNLFMLVVGECFAVILTVRFIKLRTLKSPALLACVTLLAAYHFGGSGAVDYAFDEIRFQANQSFYFAEAQRMENAHQLTVFDWGSSGFLDSGVDYYLVFDSTGRIASGVKKPADLAWQNDNGSCEASIRWLSGRFYSFTVWCLG